jgi:hypothetical protein
MRAESEGHISSRVGITALERIVMGTVYVAVTALIVWLIFFAPGRTGDSEPRPAAHLGVRSARLIRSTAVAGVLPDHALETSLTSEL